MADKQQAANQKQGECDDHALQQNITEKLTNANEGSSLNVTITNTCYDCLERIFDHLDFGSLMNVAGTCKRLQTAAAAKFEGDHGEKTIVLKPAIYQVTHGIFIGTDEIDVIGLKFLFPFLRCFGAKISKLIIDETMCIHRSVHLDQYINQYCADTLTSQTIQYRRRRFNSWGNSPKPFKHVEKVVVTLCYLDESFAHVNNTFPNLRHLVLSGVDVDGGYNDSFDGEHIFTAAVSFPHLERLDISFTRYLGFGLQKATDVIKANRQLQSLHLSWSDLFGEVKLITALNMISENTLITELSIHQLLTKIKTDELMRLALEHPLMVELDFRHYIMTADDVIVFIQNLNLLKKFEFRLVNHSQCDRLRSQLGSEWQLESVTIKRKSFILMLIRS